MKKCKQIARICAFCLLLASVGVALNACSSTTSAGGKTVIVKKAPVHHHKHRHGRFWWR